MSLEEGERVGESKTTAQAQAGDDDELIYQLAMRYQCRPRNITMLMRLRKGDARLGRKKEGSRALDGGR